MSRVTSIARFGIGVMAVLAVSTTAVAGELVPFPFEARFEMRARGFVIANVDWLLRQDEGGFVFESRSEAAGVAALLSDDSITERSEWSFKSGVSHPIRYRYERTGKRERATAIDFDWDKGIATATSRGQTARYPVPEGTQDRLSYVLAVMRSMRRKPESIRLPVATARELRDYRFDAGPAQTLETALGDMDAIPVTRARDDDSRETIIWLAPSLDYMPVRIDHRESDGEVLVIQIQELKR